MSVWRSETLLRHTASRIAATPPSTMAILRRVVLKDSE